MFSFHHNNSQEHNSADALLMSRREKSALSDEPLLTDNAKPIKVLWRIFVVWNWTYFFCKWSECIKQSIKVINRNLSRYWAWIDQLVLNVFWRENNNRLIISFLGNASHIDWVKRSDCQGKYIDDVLCEILMILLTNAETRIMNERQYNCKFLIGCFHIILLSKPSNGRSSS